MRVLKVCLAAALVLAVTVALAGQTSSTPKGGKTEIKKVPPSYTNPTSGLDMYQAYCASCHGVGGTGNGPAAAALKTTPANLTQLAKQSGGTFPAMHVMAVIKGDSTSPAHGSKEMPVWGPVFLQLEKGHSDTAQLRIHNLTNYLQSIQQK